MHRRPRRPTLILVTSQVQSALRSLLHERPQPPQGVVPLRRNIRESSAAARGSASARARTGRVESAMPPCDLCSLSLPGGSDMRASLGAIAAFLLCLAAPTHAQEWPQRQVTIVVPFGAGGSKIG